MEWKLEELTIDGKGSYGIGAPAVEFDKEKYTYLRITDINDDGTLNASGLKSVADPDACNYVLKENDIVFARTGNSTGRSYFYQKEDGKLVYAGFLIKFSLDASKVNPRIMKYYTHSQEYYDWVHSFDTGATRGNINAQTYASMPVNLPNRKKQDRIVSILSSLDRKIELNNKINAQLEEMAQTIFKSWFIDFEPFKDGKFVESELGMIPEGWRVGRLEELCNFISRGVTPKYEENTKDWILGQTCVRNNIVTLNNAREHRPKEKSEKKVKQWDILLNSTGIGSLGRVGIVYFDMNNVAFDSHITVVRVAEPTYRHYVGRNLLSRQKEIENHAIGSTGQTELPKQDVLDLPIIIPPISVFPKFNYIIESCALLMYSSYRENERLSQLRDTLLPKLMSGEIEI